jgi:alkylation response protein AidB-like acyl-CoA dehydrogenase
LYASVFKLAFSELRQRLGELATQILGPAHGLAWDFDPEMIDLWMNSFSRTIAAGTSQIQRNIIGERILGLPK